jgi:RNA polymerase sigma-70 factor, ECF subfamily
MPETAETLDSDETLVGRFQSGDEQAFDELVRRHRATVYRTAWRLTRSHSEADDLSQEAFLRAYRALGGFRRESLFRTWMVRIVMNLAMTWRRSYRPSVPVEEVRPVAADGLATDGVPLAERAVLRSEVREAVDRLPRRQRQVLMLKVYDGMKFSEIATVAGMSVGTAKATFFQAVRGLRRRLGLEVPPAGGQGVET